RGHRVGRLFVRRRVRLGLLAAGARVDRGRELGIWDWGFGIRWNSEVGIRLDNVDPGSRRGPGCGRRGHPAAARSTEVRPASIALPRDDAAAWTTRSAGEIGRGVDSPDIDRAGADVDRSAAVRIDGPDDVRH